MLFGYTGNTAVGDPLRESIIEVLNGFDTFQSRWKVAARLCPAVKRVLDPAYENFTPSGASWAQILQELGGSLLVLGRDDGGHWLLDINHHATATPHWERGFHTVGSGSQGAEVVTGLYEHHDFPRLDLWRLKLLAYRSVATCIKVLGPSGVGGRVGLWSSADGGGFAQSSESELDGLRRNVEEWERNENEAFGAMTSEEAEPLPAPVD